MKYLRSILSVLSAPVIYGMLCVPAVEFLYGRFPQLVNESGGTSHVPLLLGTELLQLLFLFVCGYVTALLAPGNIRTHAWVATVLMLGIGISVQLSFWDAAPVWHHFVFFACIVIGMIAGANLRQRQLAGTGASNRA